MSRAQGELVSELAVIDPLARVGENSHIFHFSTVANSGRIGANCMIGQNCYIAGTVGDNCRIQNGTHLFEGVTLEDDVFIGPNVTFTNVKRPQPGIKQEFTPTLVKRGATIGAGAVIVCGVTIGAGALVGAGAVVTRDVPALATVVGNPARVIE